MLHQSNLLLNVFILVFVSGYVTRYVIMHYDVITMRETAVCHSDCLEAYFAGPPVDIKDPGLLDLVKDSFLEPPPSNPDRRSFDIYSPVWRKLVDWYRVQENLWNVWKDSKPGFFVEVGAVDGEFMSQTLMLERNLSWTGLLIEPDPRSYKVLKERRRNAWTTPLCVHYDLASPKKYWLRDLEEDLPEHFLQLLMARSKLDTETLTGDEERGRIIWVKCMTLTTILLAANKTSIDLLTISTGSDNDENRIKDVTRSRLFDVKSLLIHYPTGRLFTDPYPNISGYFLDMSHSTLLVKYYVKASHCKLISDKTCRKIHYFDTIDACSEYLCFGFLTVWTRLGVAIASS